MKKVLSLAVGILVPVAAFGQSPLIAVTPVPEVTLAPAGVPTAYPTASQFGSGVSLKTLTILNQYNVDVKCSYGISTPAPFTVPAGAAFTDNYSARGAFLNGGVSCTRPANTPASGNLMFSGAK